MSFEVSARRHPGRGLASVAALCAAVLLGGCGGQAGSVADDSAATKLGNLLAFNSTNAPAGGNRTVTQTIDCPLVQIEPGASAVRVGGEDAASVRYQIAIGDVARDCSVVNGQLLVRVGVETRTAIGPAGSPGTYTAPLRVAIRHTAGDEKELGSKTYRVGGAVGSTGTAISSLIAEPLSAPYINEHAADDYEIVLALGKGESEPKAKHRRTH